MIDIKNIQQQQLDILKALTEFLEAEEIQYFAIGGTALGAIRHQGFIPWDDDIDLAILRPDYEKLLKIQSKLPQNLFILNSQCNENYPLLFAKVMDKNTQFNDYTLRKFDLPNHIFIDIFPWDNISSRQPFKKLCNQFRRSVYKNNCSLFEKAKFYFYKTLYGFKSPGYFYNKLLAKIASLPASNTWGSVKVAHDILEYDDIFPLKKVPFEDTHIYIPNQCEKYLSNKYGDFMKLPPENERTNHSSLAQNKQ